MTDEKKSQIIGIAVMVIIVFGIGIMLICSTNMKKKENAVNMLLNSKYFSGIPASS